MHSVFTGEPASFVLLIKWGVRKIRLYEKKMRSKDMFCIGFVSIRGNKKGRLNAETMQVIVVVTVL